MRSRYIPIRKANVYISNGFKKLFYGMRTLYKRPFKEGFYVRYKIGIIGPIFTVDILITLDYKVIQCKVFILQ